jgi:DNA-nicking Smr family endonuclease
MSRKKESEKTFRHDPFSDLKGFAVSAQEKKEPPAAKPAPPVAPAPDAPELFAAEMERLGVARREGATLEPPQKRPPAPVSRPAPATDAELFRAALGEMETVFADEVSAEEEGHAAAPRRMRQLRRGELVPEARLDLHGLSREQARRKVLHFLDDARYQGLRTVLVITGKGIGSGAEPVLRAEIERLLRHEAGAWVAEWGRAPRQYGGEGALVVFLRCQKGAK